MAQVNAAETKSSIVKPPPSYKDVVVLRVKQYKYGKSSKGNEQITLETEIVSPEKVTVDNVEFVLAGQEITFYLGLSDSRKGKQKQSPLAALKEFHEKLGLPVEFDTEALPYEGLLFEYYAQTQEKVLQRKDENGDYVPIMGADGKPRNQGWEWSNFLGNVLGPSDLKINAPY